MDQLDRLQHDIERWSEARSHINAYRKEGTPHLRNDTLTHVLVLIRYVQNKYDNGTVPRKEINEALAEVMS